MSAADQMYERFQVMKSELEAQLQGLQAELGRGGFRLRSGPPGRGVDMTPDAITEVRRQIAGLDAAIAEMKRQMGQSL